MILIPVSVLSLKSFHIPYFKAVPRYAIKGRLACNRLPFPFVRRETINLSHGVIMLLVIGTYSTFALFRASTLFYGVLVILCEKCFTFSRLPLCLATLIDRLLYLFPFKPVNAVSITTISTVSYPCSSDNTLTIDYDFFIFVRSSAKRFLTIFP